MNKESKMQWLFEEWIGPLVLLALVIWCVATVVRLAS